MKVKARFYIPEIVFGLLLAVAIFAIGAVVGSSFYQPSTHQQTEQRRASVEQPPTSYVEKLYDPISVFTFFVMIFTYGLMKIGGKQVTDSRVIQRAYLKMSHTPPGIIFRKDGFFNVQIEVKNFGSTPATVTHVALDHVFGLWPDAFPPVPPAIERVPGDASGAYLVRDDKFYTTRHFEITDAQIADLKDGKIALCIFGHVDYIDAFGVRQRAGYGRAYERSQDVAGIPADQRNNLVIVSRGSYNYERVRRPGEGEDWDH